MSFVLSEININEEAWFGMGGCSLITSVCVPVFAEEDAGKAGRVRASEWNTNVAAYLCSIPALTFLWSHSRAAKRTGRAGEEVLVVDALESQSCLFIEHSNSTAFAITCTGVKSTVIVVFSAFQGILVVGQYVVVVLLLFFNSGLCNAAVLLHFIVL